MRRFDDDMYELDPVDEELRENYEIMDSAREAAVELALLGGEKYRDVEYFIWEEELDFLLHDIGINAPIDFGRIPLDRLDRIYNRHHLNSLTYDDFGNEVDYDPLPRFHVSEDQTPQEGLFSLGFNLGLKGELGTYYKILPEINFSRGWWCGLYMRGLKEKDPNIVSKLREEIAVYDPNIVDFELARIVLKSKKVIEPGEPDEEEGIKRGR